MPRNKVKIVHITDNSAKVLKEFKEKAVLALQEMGEKAEGYAKADCPVDTGNLRDSIANKVIEDEKALYVGTDVEYAQGVEYNDTVSHRVGKAHYLRDSVATHSDEYESIVKNTLKEQ